MTPKKPQSRKQKQESYWFFAILSGAAGLAIIYSLIVTSPSNIQTTSSAPPILHSQANAISQANNTVFRIYSATYAISNATETLVVNITQSCLFSTPKPNSTLRYGYCESKCLAHAYTLSNYSTPHFQQEIPVVSAYQIASQLNLSLCKNYGSLPHYDR